jgi:hypothetical protein
MMQKAIKKALETWHNPDNPLYHGFRHPTLKLAGEIGELLDLYAKHKFKPRFDWMQCKYCGNFGLAHQDPESDCWEYVPLVLDELGDIWYYLRILAWINDSDITYDYSHCDSTQSLIIDMYSQANAVLQGIFGKDRFNVDRLKIIYGHSIKLLALLDTDIDELTELNYQKLNSEPTNHGWKDAR